MQHKTRSLWNITTWCAFSCLLFAGHVAAQKLTVDTRVKGELLVKFSTGAAAKTVNAVNREIRAVQMESLGDLGWQRVKLPKGMSIDDAIELYKKKSGVEDAQPNFYYHLLVAPNDPQYLDPGMYGLGKISAPSAWDLSTGSSSVVVADIDTGLRYTHEDIAANAWTNPGEIPGNGIDDDGNGFVDDVNGWDFFYNDPDPIDDLGGFGGHGTHTAGTIGAVGNNLTGVVGVNWTIKIMAIKIYSASDNNTTSSMLINAYNYVRMMKLRGVNIRVTNNSYGGCSEACGYDQATKDAIDAMGDAGILNVFAAGNNRTNNDTTPFYPGSYTSPSIIAVGGSDQNDNNVYNFGANSVDLDAPGVNILSTTNSSDSSYGTMSGTSMATPHVTGAAALLAAYNPNLSAASLKATLMNTVDVLPSLNGLTKTGGRLNVDRALRNQTVCTFTPATSLVNVPTKGGMFTVNVSAGQNCDYSAKSNAQWVHVTSSDAMSGNSSIIFHVTVNPTVTRIATVKVGDQTFTVRQSRN